MTDSNFRDLLGRFPRPGQLRWIGLRPARNAPLVCPPAAAVDASGLVGDRYNGRSGRRAITLIQWRCGSRAAGLSPHPARRAIFT